jgi:hypothetical protein
VYSLPLGSQGSLLIFFIFYEKETEITEIKQSNMITEIKRSNINLTKIISKLNYLIETVNN